MEERLLSIKDVKAITTLSHTTIYKKIKLGEFPKPLKITGKSSAWRYSDIAKWIEDLATEQFA